MNIMIVAMLASAQALPFLDRAEMNSLAQIESLQARAIVVSGGASARTQLATNMRMVATVCGAAGRTTDPVSFLGELSSAYAMTREESLALRSTCAAYLSGRLDAQRSASKR